MDQTNVLPGEYPDFTKSMNRKELRLVNRKHALLREQGGNGTLTLVYHGGMLVKVLYMDESLTKNEPEI